MLTSINILKPHLLIKDEIFIESYQKQCRQAPCLFQAASLVCARFENHDLCLSYAESQGGLTPSLAI